MDMTYPSRREFIRAGSGVAIGLIGAGGSAAQDVPGQRRPAGGTASAGQAREAVEPELAGVRVAAAKRAASPRRGGLKVSLAAYSFRKYLPRGNRPGEMTLEDLVDKACEWAIDGVELTSYYFTRTDRDALHRLKRRAHVLGLDVSGTAVGNNFCMPAGPERDRQLANVRQWIDNAVELAAPMVRIFAGRPYRGASREQAFAWYVDTLKQAADYAARRGVLLALENHGYLTETADAVLAILEAVGSPWVGLNLDTGNFRDKPYENIAKAAPHAINCHIKVQMRDAEGRRVPADLQRVVETLYEHGYRGYISLEYEAAEDPLTAVPRYLATLLRLTGRA